MLVCAVGHVQCMCQVCGAPLWVCYILSVPSSLSATIPHLPQATTHTATS